jgi:glycerol kinase
MENLIIAIDQSTSATKAMLFNERCEMLRRVNVTHEQYYPKSGWSMMLKKFIGMYRKV